MTKLSEKAKKQIARWRKSRLARVFEGSTETPGGEVLYAYEHLNPDEWERFKQRVLAQQEHDKATGARK